MKTVTGWGVCLLAGLATGCATAHIEAMRDPSLNVKLRRVYVLVEHGSVKSDYDTLLRTDISELLTKEGVENQTEAINPLELDEKAYLGQIAAYKPDAVLVVKVTGGTRSEYGGYLELVYDASLFNPAMDKRLWRAQVTNEGGTAMMKMRFKKMAESIVNRLKLDNLI